MLGTFITQLFLIAIFTVPQSYADIFTVQPTALQQWSRVQPANLDTTIDMHIYIKQNNLDRLQHHAEEVSNPYNSDNTSNEHYTSYWSNQAIHELVQPSGECINTVTNWLNEYKINDIEHSINNDAIQLHITVGIAQQLLNTTYYTYYNNNAKQHILRCEQYTVPSNVAQCIDIIGPTTRFSTHSSLIIDPIDSDEKSCNDAVTPTCIRDLYNVDITPNTTVNNSIGIASYLEQYFSFSDLQHYIKTLVPSLFDFVPYVIGPNVETSPGSEASLDIQTVTGVTMGVNTTVWYTPGRQPYTNTTTNEPFLKWLYNIQRADNIPYVISTSYGDNEDTVDHDYAKRVNVEFQKLALRGITLLFSSGDGGVGGSQTTECTQFIPNFPTSSPYVLSVGGTANGFDGMPEIAVNFSSGGFSNYFNQPAYQHQAVHNYLHTPNLVLPDPTKYNTSGRAFPDVAALARRYDVVLNGTLVRESGTSASCPTVASIIALLNDARLSVGKQPLGFVNPLFYKHSELFNDITIGHNPGCNTQGFYCTAGWDAVTGLGSPNFATLKDLVLSLP